MTRVDPVVLPALSDLARGLRAVDTPFCIIGALVPELLLDVRPPRSTNDTDATVILASFSEFEQLKDRLADFGFERTARPYRLVHRSGAWVDLLPYSERLAPAGRLQLEGGRSLNMAGFEQVLPSALEVRVTPGLTVPVLPLPLYVLLKLVAFGDRREPKDLASVLHCLRHYAEKEDRRYGLDYNGDAVLFEQTTAYLLGQDCRRFLTAALSAAVSPVLNAFESPDASVVGTVAREEEGFGVDEGRMQDVFELFQSFREGAGLSDHR
jgi:predicted nucleotidyltransferase